MTDCFANMDYVSGILDKIQSIINKLRYRQHELEVEYQSSEKLYSDMFLSIDQAGEMIDADMTSAYIDDDISPLSNANLEALQVSNDFTSISKGSNSTHVSATSSLIKHEINSARFHTLKKRVVTRWNTILIMIRSYAENISSIETILGRLKHYDLILSASENETVFDLIKFLSLFESATTILSASKSYSTIDLCLLLRIVSVRHQKLY